MNENNINQTPVTPPNLVVEPSPMNVPNNKQKVVDFLQKLKLKISPIIQKNKVLVAIALSVLGLMVLVIIIGLIFGKKNVKTTSPKPTSTPQVVFQEDVSKTEAPNTLTEIGNELDKIKKEITDLDVQNLPIRPPAVDYKISF